MIVFEIETRYAVHTVKPTTRRTRTEITIIKIHTTVFAPSLDCRPPKAGEAYVSNRLVIAIEVAEAVVVYVSDFVSTAWGCPFIMYIRPLLHTPEDL